MKDARGHGSNAHNAGIEAATEPTYSWSKYRDMHTLSVDGNFARQIGSVMTTTDPDTRKRTYRAQYDYPHSTGNANSGWSFHKSVTGAKAYVESNLAKFWEPPKVKQ